MSCTLYSSMPLFLLQLYVQMRCAFELLHHRESCLVKTCTTQTENVSWRCTYMPIYGCIRYLTSVLVWGRCAEGWSDGLLYESHTCLVHVVSLVPTRMFIVNGYWSRNESFIFNMIVTRNRYVVARFYGCVRMTCERAFVVSRQSPEWRDLPWIYLPNPDTVTARM